MPRRSPGGILAALAVVVLLVGPGFAADGNPQTPAAQPNQAGRTAEKDPFAVPDGTIDELRKYIDGLSKIQPSSSLRPEVAALHKKRATAQLKASEKILAAQPTAEQAQAAVRLKVAALVVLGRLGDETAQTGLEAAVDQVRKLGLNEMVREVQLAALESRSEQAAAMTDEAYGKFVQRLAGFLKDGPVDAPSARLAVTVATAAERSDRPGAGRQGLPGIGNRACREQG